MLQTNTLAAIEQYLLGLDAAKAADMRALHAFILGLNGQAQLWFDDGKNAENKTVSNPNIGYGNFTQLYADGSTKEFFQIGISANTTGISIYILGKKNKGYLAQHFGSTLGKAKITGYCIKFKNLQAINLDVLQAAILYGFAAEG